MSSPIDWSNQTIKFTHGGRHYEISPKVANENGIIQLSDNTYYVVDEWLETCPPQPTELKPMSRLKALWQNKIDGRRIFVATPLPSEPVLR